MNDNQKQTQVPSVQSHVSIYELIHPLVQSQVSIIDSHDPSVQLHNAVNQPKLSYAEPYVAVFIPDCSLSKPCGAV